MLRILCTMYNVGDNNFSRINTISAIAELPPLTSAPVYDVYYSQ